MTIVFLAIGAGLGAVSRFGITNLGKKLWPGRPYATLVINVAGALLAGFLFKSNLTSFWQLVLVTGFCGGFTTFSTFTLDTIVEMRNRGWWHASLYAGLTLVLGVVAFLVGMM